jgi:hypothetical protein
VTGEITPGCMEWMECEFSLVTGLAGRAWTAATGKLELQWPPAQPGRPGLRHGRCPPGLRALPQQARPREDGSQLRLTGRSAPATLPAREALLGCLAGC